MNSSSRDSLISYNSNSVTSVTASNEFVPENNHSSLKIRRSSSDDDNEADSAVNENYSYPHNTANSTNVKHYPPPPPNYLFLEQETTNRQTSELRTNNRDGILSKTQGDQQRSVKRPSISSKTAGANSSLAATANNHRKNLKLRQRNMDHDYRFISILYSCILIKHFYVSYQKDLYALDIHVYYIAENIIVTDHEESFLHEVLL